MIIKNKNIYLKRKEEEYMYTLNINANKLYIPLYTLVDYLSRTKPFKHIESDTQ